MPEPGHRLGVVRATTAWAVVTATRVFRAQAHEASAQAKGLAPNADVRKAAVGRTEGPLTADLEKLRGQGNPAQNVLVRLGDSVIAVDARPTGGFPGRRSYYPGSIGIRRARDRSVLRVVETAIPKPTADLRRVVIHRVGASGLIVVDLKRVTDRGARHVNVEIRRGDLVFAPEVKKVYAVGPFNTPKMPAVADGMRVMEPVGMAGASAPMLCRRRRTCCGWSRASPLSSFDAHGGQTASRPGYSVATLASG